MINRYNRGKGSSTPLNWIDMHVTPWRSMYWPWEISIWPTRFFWGGWPYGGRAVSTFGYAGTSHFLFEMGRESIEIEKQKTE